MIRASRRPGEPKDLSMKNGDDSQTPARRSAAAFPERPEKPAAGDGRSRRRFLQQTATTAMAVGVGAVLSRRAVAKPEAGAGRLDRTNLLIYRDAEGEIQPVRSQADWLRRKAAILEAMQEVMGPLPERAQAAPLDVKIQREVDEGSYLQRLISYTGDAGDRVPAYLLIPKRALESGAQLPGLLGLLGTGMSANAFSTAALESEGLPRWNDSRDYAREVAERGFVTLIPAYPHLGEYRPDLKGLGYQSGTMKAVWNNIRGLDLMDQLPFVRSGRYGAIGHSLGGHNAIYTGVFDGRIAAVVSSCGFDSYVEYMDGKIDGWAQERYMPKIKDYPLEEIPFDFHEMIAALAPRGCFVNAPRGDSNFKWKSAAEVVDVAKQIYRLYGVEERLQIEHPDAGAFVPRSAAAASIPLPRALDRLRKAAVRQSVRRSVFHDRRSESDGHCDL